jgi:phospholipase C
MAWQDEIRHVVVLMLENQSFDRLLGFLRLDDPSERVDGVTGDEAVPLVPGDPSRTYRVRRATTAAAYVTDPGPGHSLEDVNVQVFGGHPPPDPATPTMDGFVWNYALQAGADGRPIGPERAAAIMECLDPALVPVITTLARSFVVCDRWFASMPGPTWPNRFFAHAGTARGLIETPTEIGQIASFLAPRYPMRTIFENLAEAGHTWAVYFGDHTQTFALGALHRHAADGFRSLERFAEDVRAGTLPSYAFLEPVYLDTAVSAASDQHPPHDLLEGERLIAWVYDTLSGNQAVWRRSLFLLLYDEHGGCYDHVPPPAAVPPDDESRANPRFPFDRLGVRVPAVIASPWVRRGRADHRVYDHTSLLATLKALFGLRAFLTRRDAQANVIDPANFLDAPRAAGDMPSNLGALLPPRRRAGRAESRLSDLQQSFLALDRALRSPRNPHAAEVGSLLDRLRSATEAP